ncbi:MAG: hypothetical protein WD872_10830 [Pirellulaceae bacterium]
MRFFGQYLEGFPVVRLNQEDRAERTAHECLATFSKQMLDLHAQLAKTKTGHAHTVLRRQIDATDRQIDRLVYRLYGLTDAEIALVESR